MARINRIAVLVALGLLLAACAPPTQPGAKAGAPTSPPAGKAAETKGAPAGTAGNPDNGRQLLASQGCIACHTIRGVEGAVGAIGPDLTGVASRAGQRVSGQSAEQYLGQSIRDPDAFTVEGFQRGVMPKLPLNDQQINDVVAFLMTLK